MPIDRAGYRSGTVMHVNVRKDICFPFHALVRVHLCSRSLAMHCIEKRIALRLLQLRFYKKGAIVQLFSRNNNSKQKFFNANTLRD